MFKKLREHWLAEMIGVGFLSVLIVLASHFIGRTVIVPLSHTGPVVQAIAKGAIEKREETKPAAEIMAKAQEPFVYPVQKGDNLTRIVRRFCKGDLKQIDRIVADNRLRHADRIRIGQPLTLACVTSPETVSVIASPEEFAVTGGASREKHTLKRPSRGHRSANNVLTRAKPAAKPARSAETTSEALARIRREYGAIIDEAAAEYSVPASVITAIIFVESGGNPDAISRTGCRGLMQLLTSTARKHGIDTQRLMDPRVNIRGGAKIFSDYRRIARGDLSKTLVFYNVGPGDGLKFIRAGTLNPETFGYSAKVRRIMRIIEREHAARP